MHCVHFYVLPYIGVKISPKAAKKKILFADRTICPLCVDFIASNRTSKQYQTSTICQLLVPLTKVLILGWSFYEIKKNPGNAKFNINNIKKEN